LLYKRIKFFFVWERWQEFMTSFFLKMNWQFMIKFVFKIFKEEEIKKKKIKIKINKKLLK